MAKQRMIRDSFWSDPYIQDLNTIDKLIFLYLLTNPSVNIAWIYEITERQICFDTNIDKNRLSQALDKLSQDGKIIYKNNWIIIINFIKNQAMNPSVEKWIERVINELPNLIKDKLGTGCIQAGTYSTLLNSTLLNSTEESESVISDEVDEKILFDEFWNLYNKKVWDKNKCKNKWDKLDIETQNKIVNTLPNYLSTIKDKQFQPYPMTYLNQERWNDDIEDLIKSIDYEKDIWEFRSEMKQDYNKLKQKVWKEKFFKLKYKAIERASLNNKL